MALFDLNKEEARFEKLRKEAASRLSALIDKRLEIIRKDVPAARFENSMGTSFLFTEGLFQEAGSKEDPLYLAYENVFYDQIPQDETGYGEDFPEHLKQAKILTEKYGDLIKEILAINEYMEDTVGVVYG